MNERSSGRRALAPLAAGVGLPEGFARLGATEKLKAILDLADPGRVIQHLRPDELYALVREIGIEDAWDLVLLGTPEQQRAVRDLEVWTEDRFEPERLDRILDLSMQSGLDHALNLVRDCDPELLALHVFGQARVTLVRDDEDSRRPQEDEESGEAEFVSPDGVFRLRCADPDRTPSVRRLLDLLYAEGVEFAQRILFAGMYDTPLSLEDQARHFREKRLEDLGFPSPDERFALWEPFDVKGLRDLLARVIPPVSRPDDPDAGRHPLALVLAGHDPPSLLGDALWAVAKEPSFRGWVHDLLYLVNKGVAARTTTYHDDEAWNAAAAHAMSLVALGLEHLSSADPDRARQVLLTVHPVHLYRTGVEVLRPLNLLAREVVRQAGGVAGLAIAGEERAEVVRAALVFPPERPPTEGGSPQWTLADVNRTRRRIQDTLAVLRFARDHLGFEPSLYRVPRVAGSMVPPTLANVLATAWARQVLDGEPRVDPLTGDEVRGLLVAVFQEGRIRPSLRAMSLPASLQPEEGEAVAAFLREALNRVEESLGRLDPGRPVHARFLGDCLLFK